MHLLRFANQDYDAQAVSRVAGQGHLVTLEAAKIRRDVVERNPGLKALPAAVVVLHENMHWLLAGALPDSPTVQVRLISKVQLKKALHQPMAYAERRADSLNRQNDYHPRGGYGWGNNGRPNGR